MIDNDMQGIEDFSESSLRSPSEEDFTTSASSFRPASKASSQRSSLTAIQRIKSLTNFHLYLSPSRLAQIDLLTDSSDDEPHTTPRSTSRRNNRPGALHPGASLADRRSRPPLRIHSIPSYLASEQQVRSYSDRLQQHHAERLEKLDGKSPLPPFTPLVPQAEEEQLGPEPVSPPSHAASVRDVPRPIPAFSRSSNPWFGYPAMLIPDASRPGTSHIRPRYSRNRKRDLVKTLLFLFMLKLQAWRDAFERALGLYRFSTWGLRKEAKTPSEGLAMSAIYARLGAGVVTRSRGMDLDWIWMVIGFLLLRGTWTRVIVAPLEALGLDSVRDLLGLM